MADTFTMGVDIGSTASKCVILKNGTDIAASSVIPFGVGTSGPERAVNATLSSAGLSRGDISAVCATGYGRHTLEGADYTASELSCHALGAAASYPAARTVIDIGGQDAKVMRLDADGRLENFLMNDKCAAGTGRFLEVMARTLELEIEDLAAKDTLADEPVRISSTCTVFAESEVISHRAKGADICALVKGIHQSVAARTAALVKRLGITEPIVMTGGVALNDGVRRAIEKELNASVTVLPSAQLNGAYGAALHAHKKLGKEKNQ